MAAIKSIAVNSLEVEFLRYVRALQRSRAGRWFSVEVVTKHSRLLTLDSGDMVTLILPASTLDTKLTMADVDTEGEKCLDRLRGLEKDHKLVLKKNLSGVVFFNVIERK